MFCSFNMLGSYARQSAVAVNFIGTKRSLIFPRSFSPAPHGQEREQGREEGCSPVQIGNPRDGVKCSDGQKVYWRDADVGELEQSRATQTA